MIFTIVVVSLFVFFAPAFVWLSIPICLAYHILKSSLKEAANQEKPSVDEWDEFDWWQDNQGL